LLPFAERRPITFTLIVMLVLVAAILGAVLIAS
jgi:hypothetical protein